MRRFLIAASVLGMASSSLLAAPKKKKTPATKADKSKDKGKGSDSGGEIEMDDAAAKGSGSASTGTTDTPVPPPEPAATPAPVAPPSTRPLNINDRPLTLGKGQLDVHGAIPITVLPFVDNLGNKTSSAFEGLAFGAAYGVDDKLEVGGDYGFSLHPGDLKGPLVFHAAYTLTVSAKLDAAVGGALIIHPITGTDPMTMVDSTTTYLALQAGAWVRYRVAPKVSLFTGLPALPHPDVGLGRQGIAFPPMPYQLTIGLNSKGAIALDLPVGVGFQATPNIYAFAATNLANLKISNTVNQFLFKDFIPLTLGGFYSLAPAKLDVGATFADDLKQAGDYLAFTIVVRYFVK